MFLNLLLLFSFINYSETPPVPVTGKKGSNVTLPCQYEASKVSEIDLRRFSKSIFTCQNEVCKSKNGRVSKEKDLCDIILMDLRLSDAGNYSLKVHYNTQTEIVVYHLHIEDKISVKKDGELKLDILLPNADKVQHQSNNNSAELWKRGHGVRSDRLNDSNGNLTILRFTANDTGKYEVLDSEGEILITLTVTEYSTQSMEKLDRDEDKPNDTEQYTVEPWIIVVSVIGALVVLVVLMVLIIFAIKKHRRQHRNTEHEHRNIRHEPVPQEEIELQARTSRDDTGNL